MENSEAERIKSEIKGWKEAAKKPINSGGVRQRTIRGFIGDLKRELKALESKTE